MVGEGSVAATRGGTAVVAGLWMSPAAFREALGTCLEHRGYEVCRMRSIVWEILEEVTSVCDAARGRVPLVRLKEGRNRWIGG